MTRQEDVYTALKYRVVIDGIGVRCCYNHRGELHCEDGPAITYPSGTMCWMINGDLHREDGPAIVWCNNTHEWYYKGVRYEKSDYDSIIAGIA